MGVDDTEIHVDWNGIMDPFDVHDIKHTPHAVGTHEEKMAKSGLARAWNGHFDMTGRVRGTVRVRGREYAVDSLERMDHSWGHRNPVKMNAQDSISASLSLSRSGKMPSQKLSAFFGFSTSHMKNSS